VSCLHPHVDHGSTVKSAVGFNGLTTDNNGIVPEAHRRRGGFEKVAKSSKPEAHPFSPQYARACARTSQLSDERGPCIPAGAAQFLLSRNCEGAPCA